MENSSFLPKVFVLLLMSLVTEDPKEAFLKVEWLFSERLPSSV